MHGRRRRVNGQVHWSSAIAGSSPECTDSSHGIVACNRSTQSRIQDMGYPSRDDLLNRGTFGSPGS
jgi:hypothetical protein